MKTVQYGIWNDDEEDSQYWELHDSLEDAVKSSPDKEVYILRAKPIGRYRMEPVRQDK